MRTPSQKLLAALLLTALAWTSPIWASPAAANPPGQLQLPDFDSLASHAVQTVNITLDPNLLSLAAGFLDSSKPDESDVKQLIAGLKGIYVRSYTFDKDYAYPTSDVEFVRKQLSQQGWQRLVQVHNVKEQTNVDIYLCASQSNANGLAIIASKPREFTVVNIVGSIDLQKLHRLEGKFGIPKMQLDQQK
jgi:Domain of unknown function (DUF4252)